MTLPVSISERIRLLRQEIAELELADKIGPRNGPVANSDRERRRQRLEEIKEEITAMTEWRALTPYNPVLPILPFRHPKVMEKCPEYARLETAVSDVLARLANVATIQVEMFRAGNHSEFARLDKEIELIVGEKERAIGALRQHSKEHQCWPIHRSVA